jgi:hypothetical protein
MYAYKLKILSFGTRDAVLLDQQIDVVLAWWYEARVFRVEHHVQLTDSSLELAEHIKLKYDDDISLLI